MYIIVSNKVNKIKIIKLQWTKIISWKNGLASTNRRNSKVKRNIGRLKVIKRKEEEETSLNSNNKGFRNF